MDNMRIEELEALFAHAAAEKQVLLEALKRLVQLNDDYSPFGGEMYQDRIDGAWQKAKAAIAQAEGK